MASLTNTKIKDTYDGLLKTTDNDALGGTYKLITDGLGNSSGLYLGTGGRLGIGTSSPSDNLEVNGAIRIADQYELKFGGTTASIFGSSSLNQLRFYTNNSERLRIDSSGNVTIRSGNKLILNRPDNSIDSEISTDSSGTLILNSRNGEGFDFQNGGTSFFTADSSGRLGLGTSSPSANLHISGTSDVGLRIKSGASSLSYIDFDDADSGTPSGSIAYNNIVDAMTFATGGSNTERLRIESTGDIKFNLDSITDTRSLNFPYYNASNAKTEIKTTATGDFRQHFDILMNTAQSDSAPTSVFRIDSSGRVLIGTSSYATFDMAVINGSDSVANDLTLKGPNTSQVRLNFSDPDENGVGELGYNHSTNSMRIVTNGVERMVVDSSGQVGIGTSSPDFLLSTSGTGTNRISVNSTDSGTSGVYFRVLSGGSMIGNGTIATQSNGDMKFFTGTSSEAERMTITSGGDIWIGRNNDAFTDTGYVFFEGGTSYQIVDGGACQLLKRKTTDGEIVRFYKDTSQVGNISVTGTATAYNTSSDYRLKENVVDLTGALDRVDQLEPKRFNFIADEDTTVDGFLAHEVQDIVPEAVTGEKDAVDDEGNPQYQGIDQSKIVPLLVGAIKELKAEIETLKSQINS